LRLAARVCANRGEHGRRASGWDGLDRRDHRARDRRGAEWRGGAEGEEKTAAGFGGTGGQGVAAPRPKAKLLEEPSGSLETSAAESADELLHAVADEEQSNRCSC
jgi:hypothetical protein